MDEILLKQLVRQLKILNLWIAIGGTLLLISFLVCIFLLFKMVTFMQDTSDRLTSIQQNLRLISRKPRHLQNTVNTRLTQSQMTLSNRSHAEGMTAELQT
jgi:hypothetical protein